jgi:hypothetical protein
MFALTTLAYPAVLLLLCAGAGLLVDRLAGGWLPAALLPAVGAAALIALSQLTTYASALAGATPYLMLGAAVIGFAAGRDRVRAVASRRGAERWRLGWQLAPPLAVYLLALAPVLLAGRPTFSSYMALADSAVHMQGADYLVRHGQSYAHLDLRSSYGLFINGYYNVGYPSGADTLFGSSSILMGLPLIWTFQPFNGLMLALAAGPAWLLARRVGLRAPCAALAAVIVTVPALVYGYELLGSVKEVTVLCQILTLGVLAIEHRRWLNGRARGVLPFAVVTAAGVSVLGVGFGVWPLAAAIVPAVVLARALASGAARASRALSLVALGIAVALVAALPTWVNFSGSLHVAKAIASTSNPGNLHKPLGSLQVLGVWLRGSYKQSPTGASLDATHVLIGLTIAAGVLGALWLLRRRQFALLAWVALMVVVWLVVGLAVTTWVEAKGEMLTSSVVVLMSWAGVAALLGSTRAAVRITASVAALALAGGALASDLAQYHAANIAPTARYRELASVNERFAGRGPALVTDFDEYVLYQLRDLRPAGPDFVYLPPALAGLAGGYGQPVRLDRADPRVLESYPLVIMRRNPKLSPPPAAYALAWAGSYYEVWRRRPAAASALVHLGAAGSPAAQCSQIAALAHAAGVQRRSGLSIAAAVAPELVDVPLASSRHPAEWGHEREGLVMSRPGHLSAIFTLAHAGKWQLWIEGQIMPRVEVSIDGRRRGSVSGRLDGNSLVPDAILAATARLSAGPHTLELTRGGFSPAPGDGGSAVVDGIFLSPAGHASRTLREQPLATWRALCGGSYRWFELLSGA